MSSLMKRRRVGVDIGSSGVRVVEVGPPDSNGYVPIRRVGFADLPTAAVVSGQIRQPAAVARALAGALKDAGVPRRGFVLGISSPQAAAVRRRLPAALAPGEMLDAVRMSGEPLSAKLSAADAVLSLNQIRQVGAGEQAAVETVVAGLPRDDIERIRKVCRLASAQPGRVDLHAAGLVRALVRVPDGSQQVGTIVDIGGSHTTVVTFEGRHIRSLSVLKFGGGEITRRLAKATSTAVIEAEQAKRVIRVSSQSDVEGGAAAVGYGEDEGPVAADDPTMTDPERVVVEAATALVDQVALAIEWDADRFGSASRAVSLTGGGARLVGLKGLMQRRAAVQALIGRPWAAPAASSRRLGPLADLSDQHLESQMLPFTAAIGLARGYAE